ncbi:MAG TPA: YtxH domain-containing protein [Ureibacillus sp.]|nr:YtxH domain-containing protein [Ureibacillus sp.]
MSESKLLKSVATFAIVGAIISMFDRKTREHTIETTKKVKNTVVYYAKNRDELQQKVEQKVEAAQKMYENASENINKFVSTIEEVKELPIRKVGIQAKSELNEPDEN